MRYEVIRDFVERYDNNHTYHVGDTYPRGGADISSERIKELADGSNRVGLIYIKVVDEKKKTKRRKRNADRDV